MTTATTVNTTNATNTPTASDEVWVVPDDVYSALRRALSDSGQQFDSLEWSFELSGISGYVAHRSTEPDAPALAISDDCRVMWVDLSASDQRPTSREWIEAEPEDPSRPYEGMEKNLSPIEKAFASLSSDAPLCRGMIEFLLVDHAKFFRGRWHLSPVYHAGGLLGWLCVRPGRFGRFSKQRRYVVATNQKVVRFTGASRDDAISTLLNLQ